MLTLRMLWTATIMTNYRTGKGFDQLLDDVSAEYPVLLITTTSVLAMEASYRSAALWKRYRKLAWYVRSAAKHRATVNLL